MQQTKRQRYTSIPIPVGYHEVINTPKTARQAGAVWSFAAQTAGSAVVLPDGRCDIILRSQSNDVIPIITGPATRPYRVTFQRGDQWVGIRLRPEHGALLWQLKLQNAPDAVLRGQDAIAHMPGLSALKTPEVAAKRLSALLSWEQTSQVNPRLRQAVDVMHTAGGRLGINALAAHIGCSTRHLNRMFRGHIGLDAKTYAQIVQFHRALKLITGGQLAITAAAAECGYADQAHMTRAFRRFGGFTPSTIPPDLSVPGLFQNEVRFLQDSRRVGA